MTGKRSNHWDDVYKGRADELLSWYQAVPGHSLSLIEACGAGPDAHLIDVGAGTSPLLAVLLERGYRHLWWLDLSELARERAARALGQRAGEIRWLVGDVTEVALPSRRFELWHDRAVFHFLTGSDDRATYVAQVRRALVPGGHLVMATFAEDGPERCSGLPTVRYDPARLVTEFGPDFSLLETLREEHVTPAGVVQPFRYFLLRYVP